MSNEVELRQSEWGSVVSVSFYSGCLGFKKKLPNIMAHSREQINKYELSLDIYSI